MDGKHQKQAVDILNIIEIEYFGNTKQAMDCGGSEWPVNALSQLMSSVST
jgi:hypothetical protein